MHGLGYSQTVGGLGAQTGCPPPPNGDMSGEACSDVRKNERLRRKQREREGGREGAGGRRRRPFRTSLFACQHTTVLLLDVGLLERAWLVALDSFDRTTQNGFVLVNRFFFLYA